MRIQSLIPILLLGLPACTVVHEPVGPQPVSTTYVTPAPVPTTTYVAPSAAYVAPTTTYVTPAPSYSPPPTTVIVPAR